MFGKKLFCFRKTQNSRHTACERLRLVLVQDRCSIESNQLEELKNDLIAVIDRHLQIDRGALEVSCCREGSSVAIMANIPLLKAK